MAVLGILKMLAALNSKVVVIEAVIAAIIVILLVAILVMSRQRKKRATESHAPPTDFYADLRQQPGGQADPFAAFAASTTPAASAAGVGTSTPGAAASNGSPSAPPVAPALTNLPDGTVGGLPPGHDPAQALAAGPGDGTGHDRRGGSAPVTRPGADGLSIPPFGTRASHAPDPVGAASGAVGGWPSSPSAEHAPQALDADPPAGTPAGWLPDPGGAPDTLRYWDGNAWTPHVAQRS